MASACRVLRSAHAGLCCRLLRRMLTDLHQLRIVSRQALETWWHSTSDIEAVRDVSSCLDELKQSNIDAGHDAGNREVPCCQPVEH